MIDSYFPYAKEQTYGATAMETAEWMTKWSDDPVATLEHWRNNPKRGTPDARTLELAYAVIDVLRQRLAVQAKA